MTPGPCEIPKRLADLLRTIGPIHEEVSGDYLYSIRGAGSEDNAPAGFFVEQRLAERSAPAAEGQGMSISLPIKADARSDVTFAFVETLAGALEYVRRQEPESR